MHEGVAGTVDQRFLVSLAGAHPVSERDTLEASLASSFPILDRRSSGCRHRVLLSQGQELVRAVCQTFPRRRVAKDSYGLHQLAQGLVQVIPIRHGCVKQLQSAAVMLPALKQSLSA